MNRSETMEEIKCKGTPAQVARRVLAVLGEDPDLNWHVNVAGAYPDDWQDRLLVCGRLTPDIPDDQALVKVAVLRGDWPVVGYIEAEQLPGYVLVTAHKRGRKTEFIRERGTVRSITEDFAALAPLWQKIKAELTQRGLVIEKAAPQRSGPTVKTQERAKVFKALKDKHPNWSYEKVAMEACDILAENVTGATVTNAYNAMREYFGPEDWTWERADRVR